MFIELSEFLDCTGAHDPTFMVVATGVMHGRDIVHGTIGCPVCEQEFVIEGTVARFGPAPGRAAPVSLPAADDVQAVLGLTGPGGFVVLLGSAGRLAGGLAPRLEGVHFPVVNAPDDVTPAPHLSLLSAAGEIPLKTGMARGVVLGGEYTDPDWLAEAARVLLRGRRVAALTEGVSGAPEVLAPVAVGKGMWLGEKTG